MLEQEVNLGYGEERKCAIHPLELGEERKCEIHPLEQVKFVPTCSRPKSRLTFEQEVNLGYVWERMWENHALEGSRLSRR